jgi:hypothetical protein
MTAFLSALKLVSQVIKFLPEVRKLILILTTAPSKKAASVSSLISEEAEKLKNKGRPKW